MSNEIPGNPALPRYYHRELGLVEHIVGTTIRHRDAAKRRLAKAVKAKGGNPDDIEYMAGLGPGLLRREGGRDERP